MPLPRKLGNKLVILPPAIFDPGLRAVAKGQYMLLWAAN